MTAKAARAGVLERTTLVMEAFRASPRPLQLDEVVARAGLPRSTTSRILRQLVALAWLTHGPAGYGAGPIWTDLQRRQDRVGELRAAASDVLNRLHLSTGFAAHLGVLDGAEVHYLDKVAGALAAQIPTTVGARVPAECSVIGRALLATCTPEAVDEIVRPASQDRARLHAELNRVRRNRGLAWIETGRCARDLVSLGVVVTGPSGPVAGLSLVGPAERFTPQAEAALRAAAPAVGRSLRSTTPRPHTESAG